MDRIPSEPYDSEVAPRRQAKPKPYAPKRVGRKRGSAPKPKTFSEAFWTSFLLVFGLPLVIFYLLALIGGFLKSATP